MIRAVISDLGKVIVHFDNRIFFSKLALACGRSPDEIVRLAFQGTGLLNAFDSGALNPEQFQAEVCGRLGVSFKRGEFYAIYNDIFRLIPGTLDILRAAKKTCRLILLSNTDPKRYGHILRTYPQVQVFDAVVVSFRERLMKPDRRIFEVALTRAQADPSECVFIDDRPENIAAAAEVGIQGIVFEEGLTDLASELLKLGVALGGT